MAPEPTKPGRVRRCGVPSSFELTIVCIDNWSAALCGYIDDSASFYFGAHGVHDIYIVTTTRFFWVSNSLGKERSKRKVEYEAEKEKGISKLNKS